MTSLSGDASADARRIFSIELLCVLELQPFILNSAVGRHIEMLSAVFGGAFACIFFNCGAVRLSHARTL